MRQSAFSPNFCPVSAVVGGFVVSNTVRTVLRLKFAEGIECPINKTRGKMKLIKVNASSC